MEKILISVKKSLIRFIFRFIEYYSKVYLDYQLAKAFLPAKR